MACFKVLTSLAFFMLFVIVNAVDITVEGMRHLSFVDPTLILLKSHQFPLNPERVSAFNFELQLPEDWNSERLQLVKVLEKTKLALVPYRPQDQNVRPNLRPAHLRYTDSKLFGDFVDINHILTELTYYRFHVWFPDEMPWREPFWAELSQVYDKLIFKITDHDPTIFMEPSTSAPRYQEEASTSA